MIFAAGDSAAPADSTAADAPKDSADSAATVDSGDGDSGDSTDSADPQPGAQEAERA